MFTCLFNGKFMEKWWDFQLIAFPTHIKKLVFKLKLKLRIKTKLKLQQLYKLLNISKSYIYLKNWQICTTNVIDLFRIVV